MKKHASTSLILAAVLVHIVPTAARAQNLIEDPGFEDGSPWSLADYASSIVDSPTHGGSKALKLINDADGTKTINHNVWQKGIPGVEEGREYVFTVWVSGKNVEGIGAGGKPMPVLQWVNGSGQKIGREMYM